MKNNNNAENALWVSGGVTSAVAVKIALDLFGKDNCRLVFIDTFNEDEDTYRFIENCEEWYGKKVEVITAIGDKFKNIEDVWMEYNSLNIAIGAKCSSTLKRDVRESWQRGNKNIKRHVFGFDISEPRRARAMRLNNPHIDPVFPLLMYGYSKEDCIKIVEDQGILVPRMYYLGFNNNNCFKTGCVQGGVGYWQKIQREFPEKFNKMAEVEHKLTNRKGKPVTMLRTNITKSNKERYPLFLKPHPDYPELPLFKNQKGREPKPLMECNGFCGVNDLEARSSTELEINYQD